MEIRIIEVLLYTIAGLFIAIFFIISWVDGLNNFTLKIKCEKLYYIIPFYCYQQVITSIITNHIHTVIRSCGKGIINLPWIAASINEVDIYVGPAIPSLASPSTAR